MHDPMTVAHEIPSPFPHRRRRWVVRATYSPTCHPDKAGQPLIGEQSIVARCWTHRGALRACAFYNTLTLPAIEHRVEEASRG